MPGPSPVSPNITASLVPSLTGGGSSASAGSGVSGGGIHIGSITNSGGNFWMIVAALAAGGLILWKI